MTYTPTKEELEELGFDGYIYTTYDYKNLQIKFYKEYGLWDFSLEDDDGIIFKNIYPQSKQDIETLIRLFTNPNE